MTVDIATLGLEIRSDGVVVATKRLHDLNQEAGKTDKTAAGAEKSVNGMTDSLKRLALAAGAVYAVKKLQNYIVEVTRLAGKYDMMGISMQAAGQNAGYTASELEKVEASLRKNGIAAIEARTSITRLAAAQIDLAHAGKIARAAQDLAVVGGMNSSEAFENMTIAIQRGQVLMLRTLGLNVTFEEGYAKTAKTLGKATDELTNFERVQSRVNTVLDAAAAYQNIYEKSLTSAEKQYLSLARHVQTYQIELGKAFQPAYLRWVGAQTDMYKKLAEVVADPYFQKAVGDLADAFIELYESVSKDILSGLPDFLDSVSGKIRGMQATIKEFKPYMDAFIENWEIIAGAKIGAVFGPQGALIGAGVGAGVSIYRDLAADAEIAKTKLQELRQEQARLEADLKDAQSFVAISPQGKERKAASVKALEDAIAATKDNIAITEIAIRKANEKAQADKNNVAITDEQAAKDREAAKAKLAAIDAEIQAQEEAEKAAEKLEKSYKKVSEELQHQIDIFGESERMQFALNQARSAGVDVNSKYGKSIVALALQLYDLQDAQQGVEDFDRSIIEHAAKREAAWEKYFSTVEKGSSQHLNYMVKQWEKEFDQFYALTGDKEAAQKLLMERFRQWEEDNQKTVEQTGETWRFMMEQIQASISGTLSQGMKGEFDDLEAVFESSANTLTDVWSAAMTNWMVDTDYAISENMAKLGVLANAMQAIQQGGMGAIGTGIGTAIGAGMDGWAGAAVGGSIGGMFGGMMSGDSSHDIWRDKMDEQIEALRKNTESIYARINGQSESDRLIKEFNESFMDLAAGKALTANMPLVGSKFGKEAQAYMSNPQKPPLGFYAGGEGSRFAEFMAELAENAIAQAHEVVKTWLDAIESDYNQWLDRIGKGGSPYERMTADYETAISGMEDQIADLARIQDQITDPAGRQDIADMIDLYRQQAEAMRNLRPEMEAYFQDLRQQTLTEMDEALSPLTGLDAVLAGIADQGDQYRDSLVDNGMALDEAESRTREWTAAMQDMAKAEMVGNATKDLTLRLLQAQGDEEAALAMQRQSEIDQLRQQFGALSGPLEDIARQIWAIEDAARGLSEATSAITSARAAYMSAAQAQLSQAMSAQSALETRYGEAKSAYVAALQQKIEQEKAANEGRIRSLERSAQRMGELAAETERMIDTFDRLIDQIKDYRQSILTEERGIGIESRYKSARSELDAAIRGMYSKNLAESQESIAKIPQLARTFLELSRGVNVTAGGYQGDLAKVLSVLNTAEDMAEVGKSNAEKQLELAIERQQVLQAMSSCLSRTETATEKMLAEVEADGIDTRSFEEIQKAYLEAKADFDNSSFLTEISYWQTEIDRLDEIINGTVNIESALANYTAALIGAIAGGYDDLSGSFAAELAALEGRIAQQEQAAPAPEASFAGGGTVRGPSSGYTVPTRFHGIEHITPDSEMAEVKKVLADVRGVLVQIRDTAGDINLTGKKTYRKFDFITQGEDSVKTRAA